MKFSLLPEKPILVYPSLAATIGLEESILVTALSEVSNNLPTQKNNRFEWVSLNPESLRQILPFWSDLDINRICNNLREKGILVIASSAFGTSDYFKFAFNELTTAHAAKPAQNYSVKNPSEAMPAANYIAANWQPDEMTLAQLAQHSIPSSFAYEQVPEFVTYWRERRETARSWGSKFIQQVIRKWRYYEAEQNKQEKRTPISKRWQPSPDALEVMTVHMSIPLEFIEDSIPEFVLYWQERGDATDNWNSKFVQHVRIQWKKFCSALEHSTDPKPISKDWTPSNDVYDVLRLANIDIAFADSLVPEFVLYWRDSNQLHTSWNTRFLQHAKKMWANRHAMGSHGSQQSTRDLSLEQQLNDRSWAN